MKGVEIERKWLAPGFPTDREPLWASHIYVHYLYSNDDMEVRVNKKVNIIPTSPELPQTTYKVTIKFGNGLTRTELETQLTEQEYLYWTAQAPAPPTHKLYHVYLIPETDTHDELALDMSCVDDTWYYAEVEFWTKELADTFVLPYDWQEVTGDKYYAMKNYYRRKWALE